MDIEKIRKTFEDKGYLFTYFEKAADAADYLVQNINGKTVGFGGSVTMDQLDLPNRLREHNTVFRHTRPDKEIDEGGIKSDIYILSANALSENGDVVNIDGSGNRLAASVYGHEKVYMVCGINKMTPDFDAALYRARNVAAPLNARKWNAPTPCAKGELKCYDCDSPYRICAAVLWFMKKPVSVPVMELVLVGEDLGL